MTQVSFLIPFRNNETTISRCIRSLPEGAEILLWDDHSTDNTSHILTRMGFKPFRFPNRVSLGEMRERLFRMSSGDVIVFQDADDWRLPTLTRVTAAIVKPDTLLMTPVLRYYTDGTKEAHLVTLKNDPLVDLFEINFQTCGMFWSRSLLERITFTREHCWEYDMFFRALEANAEIVYSSIQSSVYTGPGLYSSQNRIGQLQTRIKLNARVLDKFPMSNKNYNIGMRSIKAADVLLSDCQCKNKEMCLVGCFTSADEYAAGKRCITCLNDEE